MQLGPQRRAYEAIDHPVMYQLGIESEERILSHPLIQAELGRQRRDLDAVVKAIGSGDRSAPIVEGLGDRVQAEALRFFCSPTDGPARGENPAPRTSGDAGLLQGLQPMRCIMNEMPGATTSRAEAVLAAIQHSLLSGGL